MKRWIIGFSTILAIGGPLAAHADQSVSPAASAGSHLSPTEMAAMEAKMGHVETLIEKINKVYHTQFAVGPKAESMAMAHMAAANMEMAKAMMEMQDFWSATPPAAQFPAPEGGH